DILEVSRFITGKTSLDIGAVKVDALVQEVLAAAMFPANAKRIQLSANINSTVQEIAADAAKLRQVLWNLLTNAVKFTPEGGSIEISTRQTKGSVEFEVRDSGVGIEC